MSSVYQYIPLIYDRWQESYGKDFSTLIFPRLLDTLRRFHITTSCMLDLACGTGTLAFMMARQGWRVWGIDGSEGMISEAVRKLKREKLPVTFLLSDIRAFRLPEQVSLATSFFDSLNHVTSLRDLSRTFRGVHASLLPGGFFIFDVNNELCFKTVWTQTETNHHRDFDIILRNCYEPKKKIARSHVTIFLRKGRYFDRMEETVVERWFPSGEISALLVQSGFKVLEREDFNFTDDPSVSNVKTWWVARKESA